MEELANIYEILNNKTGMYYIGSTTKSLDERKLQHLKNSREGREGLFYDDLRGQDQDDFVIKLIDTSFLRHRFIIEEHYWHKYNKEGYPLYDIKRGASHSKNTKQRLSQSRHENGFDYSSEEFKVKMSLKTSGENNGMYGKNGEDAVNGRMVVAYDDNSSVVHRFPSVRVALEFLGIKGHTKLNEVCRTGAKYKGYFWKKEWINR